MMNGTGTTGSGQGRTGQTVSQDQLLAISAQESQAAHRGTKEILTLMRSSGGDQDPDDPVAGIAELLLQAEERDQAMAAELEAIRSMLNVLSGSVTDMHADQKRIAKQQSGQSLEVLSMIRLLKEFLARARN